jgi:hypothetical protein
LILRKLLQLTSYRSSSVTCQVQRFQLTLQSNSAWPATASLS